MPDTGKKRELEAIIHEDNSDIIAVTEVLPKRSLYESNEFFYDIESYVRYNSDLTKGSGVIIYVKNQLNSFDMSVESEFKESAWCQIKLNNNNDVLTVGNIYRSPNSSVENFNKLTEMMKNMSRRTFLHLLVLGDFNIKEIDWNSNTTTVGENHMSSLFLECIRDCYLYQHVREVTRHRHGTEPSLLDLIFTNESNMIDSLVHTAGLRSKAVVLMWSLLPVLVSDFR